MPPVLPSTRCRSLAVTHTGRPVPPRTPDDVASDGDPRSVGTPCEALQLLSGHQGLRHAQSVQFLFNLLHTRSCTLTNLVACTSMVLCSSACPRTTRVAQARTNRRIASQSEGEVDLVHGHSDVDRAAKLMSRQPLHASAAEAVLAVRRIRHPDDRKRVRARCSPKEP